MKPAANAAGPRAPADTAFASTPARLLATAQRLADRPAYFTRGSHGWEATRWSDYAAQVRSAARALVALGVRPGDAVCILGFNRPEWTIMDHAAMMVGAVAAGIYWTSSADEVEYIVADSGCAVLLVENEAQWARIAGRREMLARLKRVVFMAGTEPRAPGQMSWEAFLQLGAAPDLQPEVDRRLAALRPEQPGTLIYTSGTTGPPKAVVLSHGNLSWTTLALSAAFGVGPEDRLISYLPLAHVAEQLGAIHNHVWAGYQVYFARSLEALGDHLKEVHPTVFFGVPRVWEKMQAAIEAKLATATGPRAALARWALGVGRRWHELRFAGGAPGPLLRAQKALAGALVHRKVKRALGFDAARVLMSGAAPIALDNLRFFTGLDLAIGEVYGQSEDCGPTAISLPGFIRPGAVGKTLPGMAVRIADDGEILVRGPNVFAGYLNRPGDTAESLRDGWLHSGDLGRIDEDGFLYVTGRKKDLLITSGGKNVSPANIEAELMNLPLVAHAVVCGDGRHFLCALLALEPEALAQFAQNHGLAGDAQAWRRDPRVVAELQRGVDAVNGRQARVAHVRKFAVLDEPLTIESGVLTPTMKVRRQVVLERHAALVERFYDARDGA